MITTRFYKRMLSHLGMGKFKIDLINKHDWYGNSYGGFYVDPDLLNDNSVVYSFGIGTDISFDKEIIKRHQCHVYAFDPTPKSIRWVGAQPPLRGFHFFDYGISVKTGTASSHLPENKDYTSGSIVTHSGVNKLDHITVAMKSFRDIVEDLGHRQIDLLKMDIEGAEYEVVRDILSSSVEVKQIVLEVHERFFKDGRRKSCQMIEELKDCGYQLFAVSDSWEELSFIKVNKE
jgi:FkbM family methyltransferase